MSAPHGGQPSSVPAAGGMSLASGAGSVMPNNMNMTLLTQLKEKYEDLPGELVRRILEQVGCIHRLGFNLISLPNSSGSGI